MISVEESLQTPERVKEVTEQFIAHKGVERAASNVESRYTELFALPKQLLGRAIPFKPVPFERCVCLSLAALAGLSVLSIALSRV